MTIVVIWQEAGMQWCAADTRTIAGAEDKPTAEMAAKIFSIPIVTAAADLEGVGRTPHYRSQYGFAFAGSPLTASTTAVTAATLLQRLVRPGDKMGPPLFEEVAEFVHRIATAFMSDRYYRAEHRWRADTLFSAGLFGWCPYEKKYRLAHIAGRDDGGFRVDLNYPARPMVDGEPWLVLGDPAPIFNELLRSIESQSARVCFDARVRSLVERPQKARRLAWAGQLHLVSSFSTSLNSSICRKAPRA